MDERTCAPWTSWTAPFVPIPTTLLKDATEECATSMIASPAACRISDTASLLGERASLGFKKGSGNKRRKGRENIF